MADYDLLDLDETQLDVLIGEALLRDMPGASEASDGDKVLATTSWFVRVRLELAGSVCQSPSVIRYLSKDGAAEREVFDAVVAALGFVAGIPVPLSLLAAKIVRFGVTRLCSEAPTQGEVNATT